MKIKSENFSFPCFTTSMLQANAKVAKNNRKHKFKYKPTAFTILSKADK